VCIYFPRKRVFDTFLVTEILTIDSLRWSYDRCVGSLVGEKVFLSIGDISEVGRGVVIAGIVYKTGCGYQTDTAMVMVCMIEFSAASEEKWWFSSMQQF